MSLIKKSELIDNVKSVLTTLEMVKFEPNGTDVHLTFNRLLVIQPELGNTQHLEYKFTHSIDLLDCLINMESELHALSITQGEICDGNYTTIDLTHLERAQLVYTMTNEFSYMKQVSCEKLNHIREEYRAEMRRINIIKMQERVYYS